MRELVLTSRRLEDLIPYARNAVIHDDLQVAQLVASIEEFGWTNPVLIDEAGEIIAGHGRVLAAKALEMTEVPVIREDRPTKSELHPTMKPVALVQRMVEASSREEAVLFDPFGGSGTTLITAEKTNRRAFLLEVDPKYVDVIITRWQDFTGREARSPTGTSFADAARSHAHKGP